MSDDDAVRHLLKSHAIGLTGGIATGKSTVARLLTAHGLLVIDADQLARSVTAKGTPGLTAISHAFGPAVLAADGALDRTRLGALIFADPTRRRELERITHPLIHQALAAQLQTAGLLTTPRFFVYEAALLVEAGRAADFRTLWVTYCPPATQLARLMARDGLDRVQAAQRIASQLDAKTKADHADLVLTTDQPLAAVETQVLMGLAHLRSAT